jgi:hypothetical protein
MLNENLDKIWAVAEHLCKPMDDGYPQQRRPWLSWTVTASRLLEVSVISFRWKITLAVVTPNPLILSPIIAEPLTHGEFYKTWYSSFPRIGSSLIVFIRCSDDCMGSFLLSSFPYREWSIANMNRDLQMPNHWCDDWNANGGEVVVESFEIFRKMLVRNNWMVSKSIESFWKNDDNGELTSWSATGTLTVITFLKTWSPCSQ